MLRKDTNASIRKTWQGVDERTLSDKALHTHKVDLDFGAKESALDSSAEENAWLIIVISVVVFIISFIMIDSGESSLCLVASLMLIFVGFGLLKQARDKKEELLKSILIESKTKWHDLIISKQYTRVNNASYCFYTTYRRKILETNDWNWEKHTSVMGLALSHPVHILRDQDKDWYLYKDEFWLTNENHTSNDIFYIVESKKEKKRKTVEKAKKAYKPPKIKEKKKKPKKKDTVFGPDMTSPEVVKEIKIKVQEPTTPWSEEELHFAVEGYVDMLEMEKQNMEYDKVSIITMWREGVAGQPGPLYEKSREEIKKCMMNISFVLKKNSIEHVADYRPITGMNRQNITIENELIDFGILEKHSPSPKKPKVSKKTNKTSSAGGSRDYMRSFLSPDAKSRYTANPKPKKSHTGKMKEQSEIAKLGYNLQISEHSRRIALKRCVTKLGLKKVVDTMVMTLKRFKTRTNADMSGAIAKSEKDLDWLKVTYPSLWKGKWRWPNYKEFGNR